MVEAEATIPSKSSGVPRLVAKGFRTGFFDMVELRIAKKPITQITRKKAFCVHLSLNMLYQKKALLGDYFLFAISEKEAGLLMLFSFFYKNQQSKAAP